jgi:hypothetical protein
MEDGLDMSELMKVNTLNFCTRLIEVIVLACFLIDQIIHHLVFLEKWLSHCWAIVDVLVLLLLLVLRFICWEMRSSTLFLALQIIILVRWCYMLSAKRLVLDFKSRNNQGPPRERVAPEYQDKSDNPEANE